VTGLVAALGGHEHQPGCEPIDRRLLAESGLRRPTVAVLLAATVPRRVEAKIAEATTYWHRLGARVRIGFTHAARHVEDRSTPWADRTSSSQIAGVVARFCPDLTVLGLPDRTALIGRDGTYEVVGVGTCTVVRGGHRRQHPPGAAVDLADLQRTPRLPPGELLAVSAVVP
jgi:hypothetical protein